MRRIPGEVSAREIQRVTEIANRPAGPTFVTVNTSASPGIVGSTDPTTGVWSPYGFFPATFPIHLAISPTIAGSFPIHLYVSP